MPAMPFTFSTLPPGSLMGVLNITPDSFSDGGECLPVENAARRANELVAAGARVLDLGAEASSFFRKGIGPTPADEQLRRLLPILDALRGSLPHIPLSIDTRSAAVADACLARGAALINDISAGTHDPDMLRTVARHGAALILMHITPTYPATAPDNPHLLEEIRTYLAQRVAAAEAAGIPRSQIAVDPGIGFGKSMHDNWTLVTHLDKIAPPGIPVVLGISRKRFLETPPPPEIAAQLRTPASSAAAHPRDPMTAAVTAFVGPHARLHRLHAIP